MIKTTFPSLALPCPPPNPEPEGGQLSRGGVEWVGRVSQHRKWGGGCALCSSGMDGVLAFQIAPFPAGKEVTKENAFGSSPSILRLQLSWGQGWRRRYPTYIHHHAWGFRGWVQDARGRPKLEEMCSQGVLGGSSGQR